MCSTLPSRRRAVAVWWDLIRERYQTLKLAAGQHYRDPVEQRARPGWDGQGVGPISQRLGLLTVRPAAADVMAFRLSDSGRGNCHSAGLDSVTLKPTAADVMQFRSWIIHNYRGPLVYKMFFMVQVIFIFYWSRRRQVPPPLLFLLLLHGLYFYWSPLFFLHGPLLLLMPLPPPPHTHARTHTLFFSFLFKLHGPLLITALTCHLFLIWELIELVADFIHCSSCKFKVIYLSTARSLQIRREEQGGE